MFNSFVTFWLIMFIVFLGVELFTYGLISIWFCLGSLVAMIFAFLDIDFLYQLVAFIITSIIALIITKPLVKKIQTPKIVRTNADKVIGETCIVTETINNKLGKGEIKVDGKAWSARSQNDEIIEKGEFVKILKIEGVKLIVQKTNDNN